MASQIKPRPSSLVKATYEPKYRKWLRRQNCVTCGTPYRVEVAHTGNEGKGMSVKASDRDAIPLCDDCHRLSDTAYHQFGDERDWERFHRIDLVLIRAALRARYERENR